MSARKSRTGRAAAGTVADEAARLIEALGAWATSASPTAGTTTAVATRPPLTTGRRARPTAPAPPRRRDDPGTPYDDPAAPPH